MKFGSSLTSLALALAFFGAPLSANAQDANSLPARVTDFATSEAPDDHVIGSEDAALTLIVWASVTCPHCGAWFTSEWPIVKSELVETGKLRVVFRELPTAPQEMAMTGFRLAECAPQEDYMSIIEFQMEEQAALYEAVKNGNGQQAYGVIAEMAGMETDEAITTCFRNPDIVAHIVDNANRATLAEVETVPAFLLNGQKYKGKSDAKTLVALINTMEEKGISTLPKDIVPVDSHAGHDHE